MPRSKRGVIVHETRIVTAHAVTDGGTIEPIATIGVGPEHAAAIRKVMAEQGSVWVFVEIRVMDPSKMDVLGADESKGRAAKAPSAKAVGELLTPQQTADRLGLAVRSLEGMRREGRGPKFVKLTSGRSGRISYPASCVEAWLAGRIRQSTCR